MTKKVLAVLLTLCLLMGAFSSYAAAAVVPTIDEDLPIEHRFCPGTVINEETFPAPACSGKNIYSEGWEIKLPGGDWGPYDNEPLEASDTGARIRYYVANPVGDYNYSNECLITVKHNPQGKYYGNSMQHWRYCADCGEKTDIGTHTTMGAGAGVENKVCQVCGMEINTHFYGILVFMQWVMDLIGSLIGG